MLWFRISILLVCLGLSGWYLERAQQAGRLRGLDEGFLDFLVANARDRLSQPVSPPAGEVVLVTLREQDREDYGAWPPPPLDWQTIFKALQPFEPAVLVIATPLAWGEPKPDFIPAVGEALLPFPSVVMGVAAAVVQGELLQANRPPAVLEGVPQFPRVEGDPRAAWSLEFLQSAPPEPVLRGQAEIGLAAANALGNGWLLPYAVKMNGVFVPSVVAQTLARHTQTPYAEHRLRLGAGAGAHLHQGCFVPLWHSGALSVPTDLKVPEVDALDLMTGALDDTLHPGLREKMGQGKVVVVGLEEASSAQSGGGPARLNAQALAHLLALPRIQVLPYGWQWVVRVLAAAGAFWILLRVRRGRAFWAGVMLAFVALIFSYLAFQVALLWCPLAVPAAWLVLGMLAGMAFGGKKAAGGSAAA